MRLVLPLYLPLLLFLGCGTDMNRKDDTKQQKEIGQPQGGQPVACVDVQGNAVANCPVQNGGTIVVQNPPILVGTAAGPVVGAGVPSSYTFLDTPDANLCVDAFNRIGVPIPDVTVARTLNVNSLRNTGIAYTDIESSPLPILNVVHLNSKYSDVIFQFLNPNGLYCLVYNNASFSNVSIQFSCAAKKTSIEPITVNTVNSTPKWGFLDWLFGGHGGDGLQGTKNSYNSRIQELPCVP